MPTLYLKETNIHIVSDINQNVQQLTKKVFNSSMKGKSKSFLRNLRDKNQPIDIYNLIVLLNFYKFVNIHIFNLFNHYFFQSVTTFDSDHHKSIQEIWGKCPSKKANIHWRLLCFVMRSFL